MMSLNTATALGKLPDCIRPIPCWYSLSMASSPERPHSRQMIPRAVWRSVGSVSSRHGISASVSAAVPMSASRTMPSSRRKGSASPRACTACWRFSGPCCASAGASAPKVRAMVDAQARAHRRVVNQEERCMSELLQSVGNSAYRIRLGSVARSPPRPFGGHTVFGPRSNSTLSGRNFHLYT